MDFTFSTIPLTLGTLSEIYRILHLTVLLPFDLAGPKPELHQDQNSNPNRVRNWVMDRALDRDQRQFRGGVIHRGSPIVPNPPRRSTGRHRESGSE